MYGAEVVEACINAGCHYLDTNGEQDWMIRCDETYGQAMADYDTTIRLDPSSASPFDWVAGLSPAMVKRGKFGAVSISRCLTVSL